MSLLMRVTREGIQGGRGALGTCGFARGFGSRLKRFWCVAYDIAQELVWVPWRIDSWFAPVPKLPLPPTGNFASVHDRSELDLLREPLSAEAHTACEHMRTLLPCLQLFGSGTCLW